MNETLVLRDETSLVIKRGPKTIDKMIMPFIYGAIGICVTSLVAGLAVKAPTLLFFYRQQVLFL